MWKLIISVVLFILIIILLIMEDKETFGEISPLLTCSHNINRFSMNRRMILIPDTFIYNVNTAWNNFTNTIESNDLVKPDINYNINTAFDQNKNIFTNMQKLNLYDNDMFSCMMLYDPSSNKEMQNDFSGTQSRHVYTLNNLSKILNYILFGSAYLIKLNDLYKNLNYSWVQKDALGSLRFNNGFMTQVNTEKHPFVDYFDAFGMKQNIIQQHVNNLYNDGVYKLRDETVANNHIGTKTNIYPQDPRAQNMYQIINNAYTTNVGKIIYELLISYYPASIRGEIMIPYGHYNYVDASYDIARHRHTGMSVFFMGLIFMQNMYNRIASALDKNMYYICDAIYNNLIAIDRFNDLNNRQHILNNLHRSKNITQENINTVLWGILNNTFLRFNITGTNELITVPAFFSNLNNTTMQKNKIMSINPATFNNDTVTNAFLNNAMPKYNKRYYSYFKCGLVYYNACSLIKEPIIDNSDINKCM